MRAVLHVSLQLTVDLFSLETDWNVSNVITPIEHYPSYYMANWQLLKEVSVKYWWGIAVKLIQHYISWLIKISVYLLEKLQKICLKNSFWLQSLLCLMLIVFHSSEIRFLSKILTLSVMKTYLNQIHGSSRFFLSLGKSLFLFPAQLFSHQYIMPCSFPPCWLTMCPWPSGFFQALDSDCTSVKVTRASFDQQIGKGNGCSLFSCFLLIIVFI